MSREKSNFEKAVELSLEDWVNSLPALEDIPEYEYSEDHKKIMNGEIASEENLKNARKRLRNEQ